MAPLRALVAGVAVAITSPTSAMRDGIALDEKLLNAHVHERSGDPQAEEPPRAREHAVSAFSAAQVDAVDLAKVNSSTDRDDKTEPVEACNTMCGASNFTEDMWDPESKLIYPFDTRLGPFQCAQCRRMQFGGCDMPYLLFHKGTVRNGCCAKHFCVKPGALSAKPRPGAIGYNSPAGTSSKQPAAPTAIVSVSKKQKKHRRPSESSGLVSGPSHSSGGRGGYQDIDSVSDNLPSGTGGHFWQGYSGVSGLSSDVSVTTPTSYSSEDWVSQKKKKKTKGGHSDSSGPPSVSQTVIDNAAGSRSHGEDGKLLVGGPISDPRSSSRSSSSRGQLVWQHAKGNGAYEQI